MLFIVVIACWIVAGVPDGDEAERIARIMRLLGATGEEELDEQIVERFEALERSPLPINLASRSRLLACGLFTSYQAASLIDYRERSGAVMSLAELGTVDGFDANFASDIAPFISFDGNPARAGPAGHCVEERASLSSGGWTFSTRYHFTAGDRAEAAIAWRQPVGGPGTYTFTAAAYGRRHLGKIIAGDFHARFGQGLALWSGLTLGGIGAPASLQRKPSGLSRNISWSAVGYRGLAADFSFGNWTFSGGLGMPGLRPWMEGGKPFSTALMPMVNITRYGKNGQAGITMVCRTEGGVIPLAKVSADMRACWRGTDVFAEAALDLVSLKPAALAGVIFPLGKAKVGAVMRFYADGFTPDEASALRSGSKSTDEAGISLSGEYGKWTASIDGAWHPSSGRRSLRAIISGHATKGSWTWKWRLSERLRTYAPENRTDLRADAIWQRGRWTATARLNGVISRNYGLLGYLEGMFKEDWISCSLRGALFCADHWDDRIYCYERDIPGSFSVPAFYGRGYSVSLLAYFKWRLGFGRLRAGVRATWTDKPWSDPPKAGSLALRALLALEL